MRRLTAALTAALSVLLLSTTAQAEGNRYGLERHYKSEISPAKAFLLTTHDHGNRDGRHENHYGRGDSHNAIIIDVRTIEEYVGGHPPRSYSIPYPHIHNRQYANPEDPNHGLYIGQAPEDFVDAVNAMDLPKDTLIVTMCRTGYRSVKAANLLAADGYTNVRNMWEGFKGDAKVDINGNKEDLNNDGVVDDNNPYSGDLDGWANYQELPVSKRLKADHLYEPYISLYYTVTGER
jgi:rhodanese-related sulfurtransferase